MPDDPKELVARLAGLTNAELENQLRASLGEVGARRARARAEREAASTELAELVRLAADHGLPIAEIARTAQLSRPAVYGFLRKTTAGALNVGDVVILDQAFGPERVEDITAATNPNGSVTVYLRLAHKLPPPGTQRTKELGSIEPVTRVSRHA